MRPRAENNWAYDYLPKLDKADDMLQVVRADASGQDERLSLPGLQSARGRPDKAKIDGGAVEAQVPGHHGSARDRNIGVLEELRRATTTSIRRRSRLRCSACRRRASPRKTARSSTRAAGCNGTGRAPTRRARRAATWRSWQSLFLRLRKLYVRGGRRVSRSDPESHLAVQDAARADARRAREGVHRQGARRSRPTRRIPTKVLLQGGRAAAGFRDAARRRHDRVRLLDLLRRRGRRPAIRWRGATTRIPTASARR